MGNGLLIDRLPYVCFVSCCSLAAGGGDDGEQQEGVAEPAVAEPSRAFPVEEVKALIDFLTNRSVVHFIYHVIFYVLWVINVHIA